MKKQILNLGKSLTKFEQKQVNGGWFGMSKAECRRMNGHWYECVKQCYHNSPHFAPC